MKIAAPSSDVYDANVLIVGCGSVGSMAALHLASAGVRNLTLVDKEFREQCVPSQLAWQELVPLGSVKALQVWSDGQQKDTSSLR